MLVYFLRHAEAEDGNNDFARKLTAKGQAQAAKMAKFCVLQGLFPDFILTSPVIRARQTAAAFASLPQEFSVEVADWLACGMLPERCLQEVSSLTCESLLLVGHEPDFSTTIAHWIGCQDPSALHVRKASLTLLDVIQFEKGGARLEFLLPARLL